MRAKFWGVVFMIYKCIIKENNESDIVVRINNVDLLCFANAGLFGDIEDEMFLDIELYDEFDISISNEKKVGIKRISGYQYKITGVLNIEKGGIDSLIFFPIDDLYDYGYLDNKMVDVFVARLNISNVN
ncbi:hypothetical protein C2838_03075 [Pasteurella multocida]|uniref:Uncharacterized protein n=2 Tax=Pasteurella multocida TaxID=747 RepID=Q9CND3_PASMU|nr:unknown [Pasteurella multocida subsp. multocida str. Pm70]ARA69335.1 hypothetical protein BTV67_01785 [Pasteurella multocida subsp. multocida]ARA88853.1 hypothetical protein BTV66_04225 [Pasteurella multocida subsp. septica]AUL53160.1 hypothetical protein ATO47_02790 [Pasteurella multocida]AWB54526.1 hypothetical protein pm9n_02635 [Pasteurella multocida]